MPNPSEQIAVDPPAQHPSMLLTILSTFLPPGVVGGVAIWLGKRAVKRVDDDIAGKLDTRTFERYTEGRIESQKQFESHMTFIFQQMQTTQEKEWNRLNDSIERLEKIWMEEGVKNLDRSSPRRRPEV